MKGSISRELVHSNGVDVDELLERVTQAAVDELSNYYTYTILRLKLPAGSEGEYLRKLIEHVRREDLVHFEVLVPRIYELSGILPVTLDHFAPKHASLITDFPIDLADTNQILDTLLRAADRSVRSYTMLCEATRGKDHRTHNLAMAILQEKIEHQVWFLEFLGHGPDSRGAALDEHRGISPFVSKFLQIRALAEPGRRATT